ncbi:MAG: hypothetical protein ABL886_03045, partial [Rhodoglobus sp.]
MLGAGRDAYRGVLDDDNQPQAGELVDHGEPPVQASPPSRAPLGAEPSRPEPERERDRITTKQVQAIWSLVRRHGYAEGAFLQQIRERYGRQLDFLSKTQASEVISMLSDGGSNGASPSNGRHAPVGVRS